MKYMKLVLLAVTLVFFVSCADDSESPTGSKSLDVEVGQYSPAKLGSTWKYEINQDGKKTEAVMTAVGTKEKLGKTWVEYETVTEGQSQLGYMRYDNGKYYSLLLDGTTTIVGDFEFLSIDESANIGDKWNIPATVRVNGTSTTISSLYKVEVLNKLSSYDVKGKTYNDIIAMYLSLSINYFGQNIKVVDQIYYYASGFGIIRTELAGSSLTLTQEIVEYKE